MREKCIIGREPTPHSPPTSTTIRSHQIHHTLHRLHTLRGGFGERSGSTFHLVISVKISYTYTHKPWQLSLPAWLEQRSRAAPRPLGRIFSLAYGPWRVYMSRHLDGSSSAAGHLPRHKPMEFGWLFLTIVPVGPWWSNPLFSIVFALSGGAFVVSSTSYGSQAGAAFSPFRWIGIISGPLQSRPTMNCAAHIPLGHVRPEPSRLSKSSSEVHTYRALKESNK